MGLELLPPIPITHAPPPPLPFVFQSLCPISIVKCYTILQNFSPFLPVPATLGILLPTLSPPASRTPPAPNSPGLPSPCLPPLFIDTQSLKLQTQLAKLIILCFVLPSIIIMVSKTGNSRRVGVGGPNQKTILGGRYGYFLEPHVGKTFNILQYTLIGLWICPIYRS